MNSIKRISVIIILLFWVSDLSAQLKWLVEPFAEEEKFFKKHEYSREFFELVNKFAKQGILKPNGEFVFGDKTLIYIKYISDQGLLYGKTKRGEHYLLNNKGEIISDGYDLLNIWYHTNFILAKKDDLFGLIDTSGQVVVPLKYRTLLRDTLGLYKGILENGNKEDVKVKEYPIHPIASMHERAIKRESSKIKDRIIISHTTQDKKTSYQGFTNMQGDTILAPDRYKISIAQMNYEKQIMTALDTHTEKYGMFDKDANHLIPFEFDEITEFIWDEVPENQYVIAQKDSLYYLFNLDGSKKDSIIAEEISPIRYREKIDEYNRSHFRYLPLFSVKIDGKYQLMNDNFEPIIEGEFDNLGKGAGLGSNQWIFADIDSLRGFYSLKTGKYTPPQFVGISRPFRTHILGVKKDKLFALYDVHKGEYITEALYNEISKVGEYYMGKSYVIDSTLKSFERQNIIYKILFSRDDFLPDSIYRKKKVSEYLLMDTTGQVIHGPIRRKFVHKIGDVYGAGDHHNLYELWDFKKGINKNLENIGKRTFENNVIQLKEGGLCFIDDLLYLNNPPIFEDLAGKMKEELRVYKQNGLWGLMHDKKIVAKAQYDKVEILGGRGVIRVQKDGKWGLLKNPYAKDRYGFGY